MSSYYLTTPIYYVNDVPHIGHAYTTVIGDALARWHRLLGDDVFFLTGTDEHGLKVQQAAEAAGRHAAGVGRPHAPRFREAWELLDIANDDFIRTTEPRHYAAVAELLQALYDNGDIELDTYEGLYCVALRGVLHRGRAGRRQPVPDPQPPGRVLQGGELLLQASPLPATGCSTGTPRHPDAVSPSRAQRGARLHPQGLHDFSISRTSITWGVPLPWDPKHVAYVWFDALINYSTAVGYGTDPERLRRRGGRSTTTSSARTSSASTACTGRRC